MDRTPEPQAAPAGLGVLISLKLTLLRNLVRQALAESPLSIAVSSVFTTLIWFGLYGLFALVFESFHTSLLEEAVIVPVIYNVFFVSLLVLLAFSNAILAYGSLFSGREPAFLLTTPIAPVNLVLVKYLESLFFASWSLILLGLPLMMAMAHTCQVSAGFYVMFVAFFLFFVPIPGAAGLLLAYAAARFRPRDGRRILMTASAIALAAAALWSVRMAGRLQLASDEWTTSFFAHMHFLEAAALPSTWVAHGIEQSIRGHYPAALGYLAVTLANALLASWLAVVVCGRRFVTTYDRASSNSSRRRVNSSTNGGTTDDGCEAVFFYLPRRLRLIAAKDLRTFFRDPLQWFQLVIFFGLMALYLLNVPRFYVDLLESSWGGTLIPYLNLCAVTLILATFTSRFVFPLVSLEGRQLWLIGLLPMPRHRILMAKFAYALTITAAVSLVVTTLAAVSLKMKLPWAVIQVLVTLGVCTGLCGLAVGLGARLPMFNHTNAGRIANGFGGTVNLIASVVLVGIVLTGMALIAWRSRDAGSAAAPDRITLILVASLIVFAVATGLVALRIGAKHFKRVEV